MADLDQHNAIALLSTPAAYGPDVATVERIDTHISAIFLAGARAYKLKRAVRFSYLDFSTPERRRQACEAEVSLNRRTAPDLYLGVQPVVRTVDGLRLGGPGHAIDWVVVMRRFAQEDLLDALAARGKLDESLMRTLADEIARFHTVAETTPQFGGRSAVARLIDGNTHNLQAAGEAVFPAERVARLHAASVDALARVGERLERRRHTGKVRRGHGDLHLRNVVRIEGRPVLFDAIEFSDEIACTDILYDLAFLLMDLIHRGQPALANLVFNRYLDQTDEEDGLAALPLFLSIRAGIRAHVTAAAASAQPGTPRTADLRAEAAAYLDLALDLLAPRPPVLIAVGGLSGTGKSTLAHALAPGLGPPPGGRVLRADIIRKRQSGVPPESRLPETAYTREASGQVYGALYRQCEVVLQGGYAVLADAVFADPAERRAIRNVAGPTIPFVGFWLDAPVAELERRLDARRGDASDATIAVLHRQLGYDIGPLDWDRLAAGGPPAATLARARARLAPLPGQVETGAIDRRE